MLYSLYVQRLRAINGRRNQVYMLNFSYISLKITLKEKEEKEEGPFKTSLSKEKKRGVDAP